MLSKIALATLAMLVILLGMDAMKPATFSVTRVIRIEDFEQGLAKLKNVAEK